MLMLVMCVFRYRYVCRTLSNVCYLYAGLCVILSVVCHATVS